MATPAIDYAKFRALFPQFANPVLYPDTMLDAWWTMAHCAMQEPPCGCPDNDCGSLMLYLMTAHIGALMTTLAAGGASGGKSGVLTSASIDKVSVGYTLPPYKSGWQFWLSSTPYGLQLWSMLSVAAAGGFSVNGRPESRGFRKVYGAFRP